MPDTEHLWLRQGCPWCAGRVAQQDDHFTPDGMGLLPLLLQQEVHVIGGQPAPGATRQGTQW